MAKFYFDIILPSEVDLVSGITAAESHLAYRPPSLLRRSQAAGRLLACRQGQYLVGLVEIYPLSGRDWGISTLYVLPRWRGRGVAARLLKLADEKLSSQRAFIATSHPTVAKILLGLHYHPIDFWQIPKATLAALLVTRYYHPASWLKLFASAGSGLSYYVRP